jgi:hypothetical protein
MLLNESRLCALRRANQRHHHSVAAEMKFSQRLETIARAKALDCQPRILSIGLRQWRTNSDQQPPD